MNKINISLRQMQAFVVLAHTGSFRKAAEAHNLSQSALSTSIMQLEEGLGVKLFDRTTRKVELSPMARDLLPAVERVLSDVAALESDVHAVASGQRGRIVIACLFSFATRVLPGLIARFAQSYPGIAFTVLDKTSSRVLHSVMTDEADIGVCGTGELSRELHYEPLLTDPYRLVVPKGHPLAKLKKVPWRKLSDYPVLATTRGTYTRDIMDSILQANGIFLTPVHEAFHFSILESMVEQGLGVTAAPDLILGEQQQRKFEIRPLVEPAVTRQLGLVVRPGRSLSPAAQHFKKFLQAEAGLAAGQPH